MERFRRVLVLSARNGQRSFNLENIEKSIFSFLLFSSIISLAYGMYKMIGIRGWGENDYYYTLLVLLMLVLWVIINSIIGMLIPIILTGFIAYRSKVLKEYTKEFLSASVWASIAIMGYFLLDSLNLLWDFEHWIFLQIILVINYINVKFIRFFYE